MNFDFFTLGGAVFWEDVFYYQRWRIQRHCFTKSYRLLDSWDIRRARGTFETCQEAFIKYINSYEITKQQGKMVILLHGFADSKNIFKGLWRKLILSDSNVAALNYPSLFRNTSESAQQLLFFLNHIDNINEVSFVTKGMGNLVLQKVLNAPIDQQEYLERIRIGNIVEINPVIKGDVICDFLAQFKFFRYFNKTSIGDMTEKHLKHLPLIPPNLNLLKIFSTSKLSRYFSSILKFNHFSMSKSIFHEKNTIFIKSNTFYTLGNEELLNKIVNFIKNGKI